MGDKGFNPQVLILRDFYPDRGGLGEFLAFCEMPVALLQIN